MPVPRRFDRRPPERDQTRINERIRVPKVRLIGADGEQVGIIDIDDALKRAQEADLDLVEVASASKPPVARLLDYSKYKYEQEQKLKAARKHQQQVNVREIKLRPKIADHDYNTKKGHVERFLRHGDKVKVTIMFRGREQAHPERGRALLLRLYEDLGDLAVVDQQPLQEGRNMSMLVAPTPAATRPDKAPEENAAGQATAPEATPTAKPEPAAAEEPVAKPVPTPGAAEEPVVEAAPAAEPVDETPVAPDPEPAVEAEPATEAKPEVKKATPAKPKAAAKPKAPAKPKAAAKPRAPAKPKAAAKPRAAAKPKASAKPAAAAKPKAAAKSRAAAKPKAAKPADDAS